LGILSLAVFGGFVGSGLVIFVCRGLDVRFRGALSCLGPVFTAGGGLDVGLLLLRTFHGRIELVLGQVEGLAERLTDADQPLVPPVAEAAGARAARRNRSVHYWG
jgi:hypothetical protein